MVGRGASSWRASRFQAGVFITKDTENTECTERRLDVPTNVAHSSVPSVPSVSSVMNPPSPYAGFGAGWGTASRMGMFTTAASAARTMSAYHIQS